MARIIVAVSPSLHDVTAMPHTVRSGVSPTAVLLVLVATVSCRDATSPRPLGAPATYDNGAKPAANAATAFAFLPPLGAAVPGNRPLDAAATPRVEICEVQNGNCSGPVATFAAQPNVSGQHFSVTWDTRGANAGSIYRVRVTLHSAELGHVDVSVAASGKPAAAGLASIVRGQALAIKFFMERGATGVMSSAGGALSLADGAVGLTFSPDAIAQALAITAVRVLGSATDNSVIPGTQYEFGPSPITFSAPVALELGYSALPDGLRASRLAICRMTDGACVPIQGNVVDPQSRRVRNMIPGFSSYGLTDFPEGCYGAWKDGTYGFWLHSSQGDVPLPTYCAAWSPDGSRYAYTLAEGLGCSPNELHVATPDGTVDLHIAGDRMHAIDCYQYSARTFDARFPQWSPDGTKILFGAWAQPAWINADGTGGIHYFAEQKFTECCYWDTDWGAQQWHPDGQHIVFRAFHDSTGLEAYRGIDPSIRVMSLDGSSIRTLVKASHYGGFGFSTDGSQFAFRADWAEDLSGSGVYMMDADGAHLRLALPGVQAFQWSPVSGDNRLLYRQDCGDYEGCAPGQDHGLYLVNANGTGRTAVPMPTGCQDPAEFQWSPSGARIFVRGYCDGTLKAYIMNADGSAPQQFLPPLNPEGWIWRP